MRARNLKPGFFKNDLLAECRPLARILFAGLWCLADRAGRLEDRPARIKAEVLPFDHCEIEELLSELSGRDFIRRYTSDGHQVIEIPRFKAHQNPHHREPDSQLPSMPGTGPGPAQGETGASLGISVPSRAESPFLIPESITSARTEARSSLPCHNPELYPAAKRIVTHYQSAVRPAHAVSPAAYQAVIEALHAGMTEAALCLAASNYAAFCAAQKKAGQHRQGAANFFTAGYEGYVAGIPEVANGNESEVIPPAEVRYAKLLQEREKP